MNKKILLFIFICFPFALFSQKDYKLGIIYVDFYNNETIKEQAFYIVSNKKINDSLFLYKKYSQIHTGKPLLVEKYFYDKRRYKKGKYILKTIDGYSLRKGFYINNLKHGKWKEFSKIPQVKNDTINLGVYLKREVSYNNGKKEGLSKEFYSNGILRGDCNNKENHFIGDCKWYFNNGQLSSIETYSKKGEIINIKQFNKDGSKYTGKPQLLSGPVKDKKKFSRKIQRLFLRKFHYKKTVQNRKLRGKIFLMFRLNKEGRIDTVKVKTNLPKEFSKEANRVLFSIKNKYPSYYHNQNIAVWFKTTIVINAK